MRANKTGLPTVLAQNLGGSLGSTPFRINALRRRSPWQREANFALFSFHYLTLHGRLYCTLDCRLRVDAIGSLGDPSNHRRFFRMNTLWLGDCNVDYESLVVGTIDGGR